MTTKPRKHTTVLLIIAVTLLTVALATPVALAETNTDWIPPENEHNIDAFNHALAWSLDEDPDDAIQNDTALGDAIAQSTDYAYDTPPKYPEQWNDGDIEQFQTTNSKSIHPPGTDTTDSAQIKDAYITIAALTPSSTYHQSPENTILITPKNGSVYTIADYRVEVPEGSSSDTRIVDYSFENSEIKNTRLETQTGTGDAHSRDDHTSKLAYDNLDTGDTELTVTADIETTISKTVEVKRTREEETCTTDDSGNETCTTETIEYWDTVTDTTITSEHTVSDTKSVYAYEPTVSVRYRYFPDGTAAAEYELPAYWTSATTPGGHTVDGPVDTYTQRDTRWDTLVNESSTGTSEEYRSPVTPIETHAFPNNREASFLTDVSAYTNSNYKVTAQEGSEINAPTLPETIDFDVADGNATWVAPQRLTIEGSNGFDQPRHEPHNFTVNSVSAGGSETVTGTRLPEPAPTNLTVTVLEKNETTRTATVEVSLAKNETGAPIKTQGNNGYIHLTPGNQTLQTGNDGTVETTVNYTTGLTYVTGTYHPEMTFDTEDPLDTSKDTATISTDLMNLSEGLKFIQPLLGYLFMILATWYALHSMMPHRIAWPPWDHGD